MFETKKKQINNLVKKNEFLYLKVKDRMTKEDLLVDYYITDTNPELPVKDRILLLEETFRKLSNIYYRNEVNNENYPVKQTIILSKSEYDGIVYETSRGMYDYPVEPIPTEKETAYKLNLKK